MLAIVFDFALLNPTMHKVCIFLFLDAVFCVGLSSPIYNSGLHVTNLLRPEVAKIEQTALLDLLRGIAEEIFDDLGNSPLKSIFNRLNDFLQNEFDPEGNQATQLKFVVGILKELLDYLQSAVPDDTVKDKKNAKISNYLRFKID